MTRKRTEKKDVFSIEQATAMLPLVSVIAADISHLSRDLIDRRRRLEYLMAGRNPNDHDVYHEELVQVQADLEQDSRNLREYLGELKALGVEPANGPEGLVDFPAILDGRKVALCWKLGEPEVNYWHEAEAGCAQRRPLTVGSIADGGADDFNGDLSA
jgi:hypothetical protein